MNHNSILKELYLLKKKILHIMYPSRCPFCMKIIHADRAGACNPCIRKLPYIEGANCMKCGKQIMNEESEYCMDCLKKKHYFTQGISLWSYHDIVKQSVYWFKYKNKREFADYYALEICKRYAQLIRRWDADCLIPVPMYKRKMRKRGYNQTEVLADAISRQLEMPVNKNVIVRTRNTLPQKELNDKERQKNLKNAFKIKQNSVKLKKVILIDDIYTTGSTVDAAAECLIAAGAETVFVITLCIGQGY